MVHKTSNCQSTALDVSNFQAEIFTVFLLLVQRGLLADG